LAPETHVWHFLSYGRKKNKSGFEKHLSRGYVLDTMKVVYTHTLMAFAVSLMTCLAQTDSDIPTAQTISKADFAAIAEQIKALEEENAEIDRLIAKGVHPARGTSNLAELPLAKTVGETPSNTPAPFMQVPLRPVSVPTPVIRRPVVNPAPQPQAAPAWFTPAPPPLKPAAAASTSAVRAHGFSRPANGQVIRRRVGTMRELFGK